MTWAPRSSKETAAGVAAQRRTENRQTRGGAVSNEEKEKDQISLVYVIMLGNMT